MRTFTSSFARLATATEKSPRYVVKIEFDVASILLTSHAGIADLPGGVIIENVLVDPSAISQRIIPDQGRSEIGTFSFVIADIDSAFTQAARGALGDGNGLRGKKVEFYSGFAVNDEASFNDFELFQTQLIYDASFDDGNYNIRCKDITREQRKNIFDPKTTNLSATVSATDTTIPCYDTSSFSTVHHGASYSDAPSATVGYFKLDDEIIRYTGKTSTSFTGCTRAVINTVAAVHTVDSTLAQDRRPKITEYIYLELPAVKLAYAILTGTLYGDSSTLPSHWHLGIDPAWITTTDFTAIGADLWNTSDDATGFIARFAGLGKTDGKKFLESELYILCGCYSPVYADGTLGLRRMNPVIREAATVTLLDESNVESWTELQHDMDSMHNYIRINWNYNGDDFTRSTVFIDEDSVAQNGLSEVLEYEFKGLFGGRHTDGMIQARINALRDRYTYPPERISVDVLPSNMALELGDVIRLKLPNVRDFVGPVDAIDRAFEIQRKTESHGDGHITLELFGSTGTASTSSPTTNSVALPDSFYTAAGANLTSVTTINVVGGVGIIQPGTYNLAGNDDLNASGAIYYYNGDLQLADGAVLTVNKNVQLRVKGFFTINGDVNGVGRGKPGSADPSGPYDIAVVAAGIGGYVGNSRGMDGFYFNFTPRTFRTYTTVSAPITQGLYASFPFLSLAVSGNSLLGLPTILYGTSGGCGGKLGDTFANGNLVEGNTANHLRVLGGPGANSGAGLAIICRGMAFGSSGSIDLSGNSSIATSLYTNTYGETEYAGAGAAGGPGSLFIGLDGSGISLPDIGGKFFARTGTVPVNGNAMPLKFLSGPPAGSDDLLITWPVPHAGYLDPALISNLDLSNAAYRIQYIPASETATPDQDKAVPPITSATLSTQIGGILMELTAPAVEEWDVIEIYASPSNDRSFATLVNRIRSTTYEQSFTTPTTKYFWFRLRKNNRTSDWFPISATAGIKATSAGTTAWVARGNCVINGSTIQKVGGSSAWDSDVYSIAGYQACHVVFKANQTTGYFMVGLNADPTTASDYTNIDYAWYCEIGGVLKIYEGGGEVGSAIGGAYTTSTELAITYDGSTLTYYKDRVVIRTVSVSGLTLYMDSSFYAVGCGCNSLRYGPTTNLDVVDTSQIGTYAVTGVFNVFDAGAINVNNIS